MFAPIIKFLIDHAKEFAIFGIISSLLISIAITLNALIPWEYLTGLFVIIKKGLSYIDFMVDTNTLIYCITVIMTAKITVNTTRATLQIIKYFR